MIFPDAAIQFCLTIKVLFKLPLRQTTGMVAGLLKLAGLDWAVPDDTRRCHTASIHGKATATIMVTRLTRA